METTLGSVHQDHSVISGRYQDKLNEVVRELEAVRAIKQNEDINVI